MSNINTVLFDIDGVLRQFIKSVYKTLKYYFPDKVPENEPLVNEWDFSKFYPKFDKKELFDLVFNKYADMVYDTFAETNKWTIDSIKNIRKIKEIKYIFLRTHQPNNAILPTIAWIMKKEIDYDGIFITGSNIPKNIIPNSILIDDKYENILDHGIDTSIVIQQPWNKKYEKEFKYIVKNNNQKYLLKYILKIILLTKKIKV